MRVAVRRIEGVDSVRVYLDSGLAVIRMKPDNRVAVEQIREAIRKNGFDPKHAEVRIRGRLTPGRELALALPGSEPLPLVEHADAGGVLSRLRNAPPGAIVLVDGIVPETARGSPAGEVQVKSFRILP